MGRSLRSMGVADPAAADIKSTSRQAHIGNQKQKNIKSHRLGYICKKVQKTPIGTTLLNRLKSVFYK